MGRGTGYCILYLYLQPTQNHLVQHASLWTVEVSLGTWREPTQHNLQTPHKKRLKLSCTISLP